MIESNFAKSSVLAIVVVVEVPHRVRLFELGMVTTRRVDKCLVQASGGRGTGRYDRQMARLMNLHGPTHRVKSELSRRHNCRCLITRSDAAIKTRTALMGMKLYHNKMASVLEFMVPALLPPP